MNTAKLHLLGKILLSLSPNFDMISVGERRKRGKNCLMKSKDQNGRRHGLRSTTTMHRIGRFLSWASTTQSDDVAVVTIIIIVVSGVRWWWQYSIDPNRWQAMTNQICHVDALHIDHISECMDAFDGKGCGGRASATNDNGRIAIHGQNKVINIVVVNTQTKLSLPKQPRWEKEKGTDDTFPSCMLH